MKVSAPPKISVLLPVMNGERYLGDAIESLLSQSFENFEVIICDDLSDDSSYEIAQKFASQDRRLIVHKNEKRLGLFQNYNRCLELAFGEYIKPFAQDDLLHPECLSNCLNVLEDNQTVALVSVDRRSISSEGELLTGYYVPDATEIVESSQPITGSEVIQKCLFPLVNYIGEPSCVMFRDSSSGVGFDPSFNHLGDIEYWLRVLLEGDYYYIPDTLCYFRSHSESASLSNAKSLLVMVDIIKIAKKFNWIFEGCGKNEEEFLSETLKDFANYLKVMIDSKNISLSELRNAQDIFDRKEALLAAKDDEEKEKLVSAMADDLADFRELTFLVMKQLGQKGRWVSEDLEETNKNKILIAKLETELQEILNSPSWKYTKILRELNKPFADEVGFEFDPTGLKTNKDNDPLALQNEYIEYLNTVIERIKTSRSWKISRPLRVLTESPQEPVAANKS